MSLLWNYIKLFLVPTLTRIKENCARIQRKPSLENWLKILSHSFIPRPKLSVESVWAEYRRVGGVSRLRAASTLSTNPPELTTIYKAKAIATPDYLYLKNCAIYLIRHAILLGSDSNSMFNMDSANGLRCPSLDNSVVPLSLGGSPTSANSSDMFLYDDSSMSDGSLYASDQENLSTPRKR